MEFDIQCLAKTFIARLQHACERSGLSVMRHTIPAEDVDLIRRALELRAEDAEANRLDDVVPDGNDKASFSTSEPEEIDDFLMEYTYLSPLRPDSSVVPTESPLLDSGDAYNMDAPMVPGPSATMLSFAPCSLSPPPDSPSSTTPDFTDSEKSRRSPFLKPRNPPGRKGRQMASLEHLVIQLRERSDPEGEMWMCRLCRRTGGRKHDMLRHTTSHPGIESPISCRSCGQSFRRTEGRQKHWVKNPHCRKIDELESERQNDYAIRHGRRNKGPNQF